MSLVLISFTKKMNVIMSGFWKVGEEGVEDLTGVQWILWGKARRIKNYVKRVGMKILTTPFPSNF